MVLSPERIGGGDVQNIVVEVSEDKDPAVDVLRFESPLVVLHDHLQKTKHISCFKLEWQCLASKRTRPAQVQA